MSRFTIFVFLDSCTPEELLRSFRTEFIRFPREVSGKDYTQNMELFFKDYGKGNRGLLILHGLLGSGRNWHTISSSLSQKRRVIAPDLRNHGRSPHSKEHHVFDMASDVIELQNKLHLKPSVILGHSMGGAVAIELALHSPEYVDGLVVVDIFPKPHRSSVLFVLNAMAEINLRDFSSKQEVDRLLARSIADPAVRQFVLTNLQSTSSGLQWRINLDVLLQFLRESQKQSLGPADVYDGPTLFIRGERSNYVLDEDIPDIKHHFPQAEILTIPNAGHWVHHDAPNEMLAAVEKFLERIH